MPAAGHATVLHDELAATVGSVDCQVHYGGTMTTARLTPRGAATRARIVEAAADLVGIHGVAETSLDAVLAASATSKSQLYHYFADKDALVLAVIDRQAQRVLDAQGQTLHELDSIAGLRRWRDVIVELERRVGCVGGCPVGSLAGELAEVPAARQRLQVAFTRWSGHLVEGFEAMQARGELDSSCCPGDLATGVMAALQGGLLLTQTTRTTRPLELALDMAIDHVAAQMTTSS